MKKLTAVLVVLCMVLAMCPVVSLAESNTITAVRMAYFNSSGTDWKDSDGDNVLVSTGATGWSGASSFTDIDGSVTTQASVSGTNFGSARHSLIAFEIPADLDAERIADVTLSMTVKNIKQVSSGARLAVYGNSIDKAWSTEDSTSIFGVSGANAGLENLTLLGLTDEIKTGNSSGESASGEVITLSSLALADYVCQMAKEGKSEVTLRLAAPLGGIRLYDTNTTKAPTLTIESDEVSTVKIRTVYYNGEDILDESLVTIGHQIVGSEYTYASTPKATIVKDEDIYLYSALRSNLSALVQADGSAEITIVYEKYTDANSFDGYEIEDEGAWCWFGDPRAVTFTNDEGTIDVTVIGYIDVHGNIKATQVNNLTNKVDEVLIRTNIQPDDHNNPTFVMIPDGRIVVFYSRHTDEACFWYRVSKEKGDITTFGEEKCLVTKNNTTYPSPFILSDDPDHIYLCWRGIEWHPTIAKLSIPDENGDMEFTYGPYQMVRSTNAGENVRPYAKYASNGKDKIYMSYTSTHPDNIETNWLYFNQIDINTMTMHDINGTLMRTIENGPLIVDRSNQSHIVDKTGSVRNWLWQVAVSKDGYPIIANVRINGARDSHDYYYVKWNGIEWVKTFLTNAGGKYHPSNTERCYSGGMSIDVDNPDVIYCSKPVEGVFGKIWEIFKYTMSDDAKEVATVEQITQNSTKNNVRPWVIPNSSGDDLRVMWMNGDYDFWMVNSVYPKGYPTRIMGEVELPAEEVNLDEDEIAIDDMEDIGGVFVSEKHTGHFVEDASDISLGTFTASADIYLDGDYTGKIIDLGDIELSVKNLPTRYADNDTADRARLVLKIGDKDYVSPNVYGTSDEWKNHNIRTGGEYFFTKYDQYLNLTIVFDYDTKYVTVYRDGLVDIKVKLEQWADADEFKVGGFDGYVENAAMYARALNHDEIKALADVEYVVSKPQIEYEDIFEITYEDRFGNLIMPVKEISIYRGTDICEWNFEDSFIYNNDIYTLVSTSYDQDDKSSVGVYERNRIIGENLVPDGDFTDEDGNFSWGTWQTPRTDGGYNNGYYKDTCGDWFYKVNRDTNASALYETGNLTAENYALGTRWNDGSLGTCSLANFIPVEKGKTYYVAYDYKHITGNVDASYISTAFVPTMDFGQNASGNNIPKSVTSDWQTNEFTITAPDDGYIYFHFSWLGNSNNAGKGPYWYFDNFEVYELKAELIRARITPFGASNGTTDVDIQNISEETIYDITILAATYSEDNEVVSVDFETIDLEAGQRLGVELNVGDKYKVFIWDENMNPFYNTLEE